MSTSKSQVNEATDTIVTNLRRKGTKKVREGMARFAIPSDKAVGVTVADLQKLAKQIRKEQHRQRHDLALALWQTDVYEARMLATLVDDPAQVTPAQMDRWCQDFDNWAICDTACFHLFDRTPHAWKKVKQWSSRKPEFEKRAAFAVLWGLTVHDKQADDAPFAQSLPLIENAATDERNFVKKGVNMALRAIGKRSQSLNFAAITVAERLAASNDATARWVGKDALRELTSKSLQQRLQLKRSRGSRA
jgi:3-methyladenine DNA glycosylase AlkD